MKRPTLLILEDDIDMHNVYKLYLEMDYRLRFLSAVKDGLVDIRTTPPDLMLVDLKLAEENGMEFIKIVRNKMKLATPIVIVSGNVSLDHCTSAIDYDVHEIINKPFTKDHLISAIVRNLSNESHVHTSLKK